MAIRESPRVDHAKDIFRVAFFFSKDDCLFLFCYYWRLTLASFLAPVISSSSPFSCHVSSSFVFFFFFSFQIRDQNLYLTCLNKIAMHETQYQYMQDKRKPCSPYTLYKQLDGFLPANDYCNTLSYSYTPSTKKRSPNLFCGKNLTLKPPALANRQQHKKREMHNVTLPFGPSTFAQKHPNPELYTSASFVLCAQQQQTTEKSRLESCRRWLEKQKE